jgi:hypothetical protein
MKVVRLSALRTGRLYRPGNIAGSHFCYRLSRLQGHSEAGRITTPSGMEPATFRLITQCLNQLRYRGPPCFGVEVLKCRTVEVSQSYLELTRLGRSHWLRVCDRSLGGIAGSNTVGGMDVCLV